MILQYNIIVIAGRKNGENTISESIFPFFRGYFFDAEVL